MFNTFEHLIILNKVSKATESTGATRKLVEIPSPRLPTKVATMNDLPGFLESDFERAEYLQGLLINRATGKVADQFEYQALRKYFLNQTAIKPLVPDFVRKCRDLNQFWPFDLPPEWLPVRER